MYKPKREIKKRTSKTKAIIKRNLVIFSPYFRSVSTIVKMIADKTTPPVNVNIAINK